LKSGGKEPLGRDAIYWHFPGYLGAGQDSWRTTPAGAIRSGDWKLIEFFETGKVELYNLREDLGEKSDLARSMPDRAAERHAKLLDWRKAIRAPMPTPSTPESKAAAKKGGAGKAAARKGARKKAARKAADRNEDP